MIWLLILMVVGAIFYIIVKCKNENANNKNKLLKIIITINLDDDHKILKDAQKIVGKNFSPFHISSVLV